MIANLELMPLRMNESKNAKIGSRRRSLTTKLNAAGLLSSAGVKAVIQDLWLAAQAVERDFTVLTAKAKDFQDVPDLNFVVVEVP